MPVLDIDGTTKQMFGISVGNNRIDIRSNNGVIEVRNNLGVWRPIPAPGTGSRVLWVDGNRTDTYTEDGTDLYPYKTIQAALTRIGNPVDGADAQLVCIVMVQGGIYDEDLATPEGRMIILAALGGVIVGKNEYPVGTPRSITYQVDENKEMTAPGTGIGKIRPLLSLVSLPAVKSISTHIGRLNAWYITGDLQMRNTGGPTGVSTHDLVLKGVKIDGQVKNVGTDAVGGCSLYTEDVQLIGGLTDTGVTGSPITIQDMRRCHANGALTLAKFCLVRETRFQAAITVTTAMSTDFSPTGFFNCNFSSVTYTGPANSFKCDASCINMPTFAGGAAAVLIDTAPLVGFTPATPGNWTTSPTQVKAALDELGARSGASAITANTSLYISPTGSDTTGDGSSGNPWATPHKALLSLRDKIIAPDVLVTIECADGAYSLGSTLTVEHPYGNRILLKGTNTYSKTITSIASSSGAAGNWSYVLNMSDVTNVAIGDVMLIRNSGGAYAPSSMNKLVGACAITNVGASTITITHYGRYAVAATNAGVGLEAIILKARFNWSVSTGLVVKTALNISRLHCTATGGYVITVDGGTLRVPAGEPLTIIATAASGIFATNKALLDGSSYVGIGGTNIIGINCWDSIVNVNNYACGGCAIAAQVYLNGVINCGSCRIAGCSTGLQAGTNGVMNAGASMLTDNTTYAVFCDNRSYTQVNSNSIWNNPGTGIYAQNGAWVYANGVSYSGNGTNTNPAINTIGNNQALITT